MIYSFKTVGQEVLNALFTTKINIGETSFVPSNRLANASMQPFIDFWGGRLVEVIKTEAKPQMCCKDLPPHPEKWRILLVCQMIVLFIPALLSRLISLRHSEIRNAWTFSINSKVIPHSHSLKEVRMKTCRKIVESLLTSKQRLGTAIDTGDCFYDAFSQVLKTVQIIVSIDQLRLDVATALQDPATKKQIQQSIQQDPRGIESFDHYERYVQYSETQLQELRKSGKQVPSAPIWGSPYREGKILCDKYEITLHVISAGTIEQNLDNDPLLQGYRKAKEALEVEAKNNKSMNNSGLIQFQEEAIKAKLMELYSDPKNYFSDDETIAPGHEKVCSIALFENHFVPIFS